MSRELKVVISVTIKRKVKKLMMCSGVSKNLLANCLRHLGHRAEIPGPSLESMAEGRERPRELAENKPHQTRFISSTFLYIIIV